MLWFVCRSNLDEQREPDAALVDSATLISMEDKELLEAYQNTFDDDRVDIDLILTLIGYICQNSTEGKYCIVTCA